MAEQKVTATAAPGANCFKEAVCIDAGRIYDSCCEEHTAPYKHTPAARHALYQPSFHTTGSHPLS